MSATTNSIQTDIGKLAHFTNSLSTREKRQFHEFLQSPLHNKSERLVQFFGMLRDKPIEKWTIDGLYKGMFPDQHYEDLVMRRLCSQILKKGEDFLQYSAFLKEPEDYRKARYLMPELRERDLQKAFLYELKKLHQTYGQGHAAMQQRPLKDKQYYELKWYIDTEEDRFRVTKDQLLGQHNYFSLDEIIDGDYIIKKLMHMIELANYNQIVVNAQLMPFQFDNFMENVASSDYFNNPLIQLLYEMFYLMEDQQHDANQLQLVLSLLNACSKQLSHSDAFVIYSSLNNYLTIHISKGQHHLQSIQFELYQQSQEKGLLYEGPFRRIRSRIMINVTRIGLRENAFEWIKSFIETNKEHLHHDMRKSTYHLCMSHYELAAGEFEKAWEHHNKIREIDHYFKTGKRSLLIRILYELFIRERKDLELFLVDQIRNYENFVRKNRSMNKRNKTSHLNRVKLSKKLLFAWKKEDLYALKEEIKNTQHIGHNAWLLDKIEWRLENKYYIKEKTGPNEPVYRKNIAYHPTHPLLLLL